MVAVRDGDGIVLDVDADRVAAVDDEDDEPNRVLILFR